jgi:hypothetical protein
MMNRVLVRSLFPQPNNSPDGRENRKRSIAEKKFRNKFPFS